MKIKALTLTLVSLLATMNAEAFTLLNAYQQGTVARAGGSEILSFTTHENTVLSTVALNHTTNDANDVFGVQIMTLSNTGALTERDYIDLKTVFGASSSTMNGVSSVAADPMGRGFGAAALIPTNNTVTQGKVVLYDYTSTFSGTSRVLNTLDVGFHPDSISFSADGTKLIVVNEGEFNASVANPFTSGNAPGSISIIDLSSIGDLTQVSSLTSAAVSTFDFSSTHLASGVTLQGIRNPFISAVPTGTDGGSNTLVPNFNLSSVYNDANFFKGMEPEFAAMIGDKIHVTLQENNAIATFDTTINKWTSVRSLGTLTQTIDASDQDGPGGTAQLSINDTVKGLPMPDTVRGVTIGGNRYLITANEGDARGDNGDVNRLGDTGGTNSMNNVLDITNAFPATATGTRDNATGLGRLNVSRIDGDTGANGGTAGDGKIDEPVMIGTRSFSIWNADTGALVWDSGSLEPLLADKDSTRHNMNSGSTAFFDTRSDDKGPEPEALAVGQIGSNFYAFVGMERQNGLLMYDITNPNNPFFVAYTNTSALSNSLVSPEAMLFISAIDSPTGGALLLTGHEGLTDTANGAVTVSGISVHSVPEPSRALLGLLGLAFVAFRRRRA
jgi:MYXO-CTERM domain-containing protein